METQKEPLPPRRVEDSITTMTEFVLPTHANALGSVFGGQVMSWMDLCGAICSQRHSRGIVVTAGVDELNFEGPIKVGQVVRLTARVTGTFRTSLEVLVTVEGEDASTGDRWPCVTAFLTFVAVDSLLRPRAIPGLLASTDEDVRYAAAAKSRRAERLARRKVGASE